MQLLTTKLRQSLPFLGADNGDSVAYAKFFSPSGSWTWYAAEFDGDDIFYGVVDGHEIEFGTFRLSELESVRDRFGLPIERDRSFEPIRLQQLYEELRSQRPIR